jgi:hypothetical protein
LSLPFETSERQSANASERASERRDRPQADHRRREDATAKHGGQSETYARMLVGWGQGERSTGYGMRRRHVQASSPACLQHQKRVQWSEKSELNVRI